MNERPQKTAGHPADGGRNRNGKQRKQQQEIGEKAGFVFSDDKWKGDNSCVKIALSIFQVFENFSGECEKERKTDGGVNRVKIRLGKEQAAHKGSRA